MIKKGCNPYFVRELETGYVVIGDHQHFFGYTLFLYKRHGEMTELFHLGSDERAKFMEEMALVAEAVSRAFGAEKMNYELLGMGDAHLHWHLFPRRRGDIENYGNCGKGKSLPSLVIDMLVLWNMMSCCFAIGFWYFDFRSILDTLIFIGAAAILYVSPKHTAISLSGALVLALLFRLPLG